MPKQISSDLDQVVNVYRTKMRYIEDLWSQLAHHCQCETGLMKAAKEMLDQIESTSRHLLEERIYVETTGCHVRNLRQMLDVSRQILDAKVQHLKAEEQQIERDRNVRYREFQKIHKIQEEKEVIEKCLAPSKEKMSALLETLSKKCSKQKYLEEFLGCLTDELARDLKDVKAQTETARDERRIWDRWDVLPAPRAAPQNTGNGHEEKQQLHSTDDAVVDGRNDSAVVWRNPFGMLEELSRMTIDENTLNDLRSAVMVLKEQLLNQNKWYEEELRTKLFYSSRNKDIQNKIATFKTTLKRLERSTHLREDIPNSPDRSSTAPTDDFSTSVTIDGVPDVQAKHVEDYLSQQFGVRVLADYSMLRRLKEEIGVLGLAYLVERIRYQDHLPSTSNTRPHRTFKDLEERQIEMALETIAKEYRANEGTSRQISASPARSPKMSRDMFDLADSDKASVDTLGSLPTSPQRLMASSEVSGHSPTSVMSTPRDCHRPSLVDLDMGGVNMAADGCGGCGGVGVGAHKNGSFSSAGSNKSKNSLSRSIKKIFKF